MDNVLDVIELARESYLSKDGQLQVIYDAYSNWKRDISFSPVTLVESAEKQEAAQHRVQADVCPTCRGSKVVFDGVLRPCPVCDGTGNRR